ncbi:MAG: 7-cyano-7-deazaguanine synthase QueC [Pseudomonadota bacterium]|jgi:7-cyano-7-deazaguanine synthase
MPDLSLQKPADAALVMFSGGQDSTTCLAWALERYPRVETVGFDYGQRHAIELDQRLKVRTAMETAFPQWSARLGPDHVLDLHGFGQVAASALTADRAIEMTDRGLPSTFVPGRNLAFLVYAAALGDRRGIDILIGGMGEADYSGYPDCRDSTLKVQEQALRLGIERPYEILSPLMHLSKAGIWALSHELGGDELVDIIVRESHTCYLGDREHEHPWGFGCGTCPACELRAKGWDAWRGEVAA